MRRYVDPKYLKSDQGMFIVDAEMGKARMLETTDLRDPTIPIEAITSQPSQKRFQFVDLGTAIAIPAGTLALEFFARGGEAFVTFGSSTVTVTALDDATPVTNGKAPEIVPLKGFLAFDLRDTTFTHFALAGSGAVYVRMWGDYPAPIVLSPPVTGLTWAGSNSWLYDGQPIESGFAPFNVAPSKDDGTGWVLLDQGENYPFSIPVTNADCWVFRTEVDPADLAVNLGSTPFGLFSASDADYLVNLNLGATANGNIHYQNSATNMEGSLAGGDTSEKYLLHLVGTPTDLRLYKNGALVTTWQTEGVDPAFVPGGNIRIGSFSGGQNPIYHHMRLGFYKQGWGIFQVLPGATDMAALVASEHATWSAGA